MAKFPIPLSVLSKRKRVLSATALPDELVIAIFQIIASSSDTSAVYADLVRLLRVCKQWCRIAKVILYSQVEVATSVHMTALEATLKKENLDGRSHGIGTLAVAMADYWPEVARRRQLHSLLACSEGIAKLVILQADSMTDRYWGASPSRRIPSSLLDATILSTSFEGPPMTADGVVDILPDQLRFLQLPNSLVPPPTYQTRSPRFQLYGLTIPEYPSPAAGWLLSSSGPSLQCLTTVTLSSASTLAANHPNLRSLRILSVDEVPAQGFQRLLKLERLELRSRDAPRSMVTSLPSSLKYFRFWSPDVAVALEEALLTPRWREKHLALQVVVWDYYEEMDGMEDVVLRGLQGVCEREGVELRAHRRTDEGESAIECHDLAYESSLRGSCFASEMGKNASTQSIISASLRNPSNRVPARILANLVWQGVPLSSVLKHPRSGTGGMLLEDCFPDLRTWISDHLPREEEKRRDILREKKDQEDRLTRQYDRRSRLASKWGNFFLGSSALVFALTTVIFFTVLRGHGGPQLGLVWSAVAVILALRLTPVLIRRKVGDIYFSELVRIGTSVLCLCYLWAFGFFIACTASPQDSTSVGRFRLGSTIILFFAGVIVIPCITCADRCH